jgi:hypothetical protein
MDKKLDVSSKVIETYGKIGDYVLAGEGNLMDIYGDELKDYDPEKYVI